MPEDAGDKTEPPTPRRRQESRAQGQVAKSQDLSAAVLLLVGLLLLTLFGPHLWRTMLAVTRSALGEGGTANIEVVLVFGSSALVETAKALAPVFAITFLVAGLVLYAQIGGIFTWQPLMPKLSKLNPINGFKRIFSPNTLVMLGQNLLKLAAVARGEVDAYVSGYHNYQDYDMCAGHILVSEAGGRVTDFYGDAIAYPRPGTAITNGVVATNGRLHAEILRATHQRPRTARQPHSTASAAAQHHLGFTPESLCAGLGQIGSVNADNLPADGHRRDHRRQLARSWPVPAVRVESQCRRQLASDPTCPKIPLGQRSRNRPGLDPATAGLLDPAAVVGFLFGLAPLDLTGIRLPI